MRYELAVFCRKLADFLDPNVKPSPEPMVVRIRCDTTQFVKDLEDVREACRRFPIEQG